MKNTDQRMVTRVERSAESSELLLGALDLGDRCDFAGLKIRLQDHGAGRAEFYDLFEQDREDIFRALRLEKTQSCRDVLPDAGKTVRAVLCHIDRTDLHLRGGQR